MIVVGPLSLRRCLLHQQIGWICRTPTTTAVRIATSVETIGQLDPIASRLPRLPASSTVLNATMSAAARSRWTKTPR